MDNLTRLMEELALAQAGTAASLARLADVDAKTRRGWLEARYRERAVSYFGRSLRRVRVVSHGELDDLLGDRLSTEDREQMLDLGLVVAGTPRDRPGQPEVWLAIEVSAVIDDTDIERAVARAGRAVVPTVAGERTAFGATEQAALAHVLVVENGRHHGWIGALQAAQTPPRRQ